MSGATLLEDLTRRGVKLWKEGGELRCRGPKKTLTPEVLAQLKQHKPEILERLAPPNVPEDPPERIAPPLRAVNRSVPRRSGRPEVRCIHGVTEEKCAVCSGYVRWLIEDEARLHRAERDPAGVRREFWRESRGGAA